MPRIRRTTRRRFLLAGLTSLGLASSGCGTIIYPERRGQPAGRLDWEIVALDAIGLLLFFVPGLIAFAIDFSNGTIYLPSGGYGLKQPAPAKHSPFHAVSLHTRQPTLRDIERMVEREAHVDVQLDDRSVLTRQLTSIDEFWSVANSL